MKVRVYRDDDGEVRWQWIAANGRVLGDSAEGYKRRGPCIKVATALADGVGAELVIDL